MAGSLSARAASIRCSKGVPYAPPRPAAPVQFLLPVLLFALIAGVAWFAWQAEQRRREEFGAWAVQHEWHYRFGRDKHKVRQYGFLDRLQQGHSRVAFHRLEGRWADLQAEAFQLRYVTGSGKNQQTHWWSVALVRIGQPFPELTIAPENVLSRIGQALGFDDIDFESVEFSNAYAVRSRDKKFAYDFCHTGMMEYLLEHRGTTLELEHDVLAVLRSGRLDVKDLTPMLDQLAAIRERIPEYLFRG